MTSRALLRSQLQRAWYGSIHTDYLRQRVNSERCLQASLWSQLNLIFKDKPRRMFIEHPLVVPGSVNAARKMRMPDLVICNSREIIGVVELKYRPRGRADWEKDLETLEWITRNRADLRVVNQRFRGPAADDREYRLSDSALYVWAGIHKHDDVELVVPRVLRGRFLEMQAITNKTGKPEIRCRSQ